MIERESVSRRVPDTMILDAGPSRPFPSLERGLSIARLGSKNPASLTPQDIEDLSRVALMHYARMGVA